MRVSREDTLQQLDPLSSVGNRALTVLICVGVVLYASLLTTLQRHELDSDLFAIAALVVLSIAAAHLAVRSGSLRTPFSRPVFVSVLVLTLLAMVLSAASHWDGNTVLRDDWGPIAVAVMCLAMSPYRPAAELALGGSFAALATGSVALLQAPRLAEEAPSGVHAIVALTPVLALSLGGATFVSVSVAQLRAWQRNSRAALTRVAASRRDGITRSVQQERVTILNRDVVPFFDDLLRRGTVSAADRERAAAIADRVRGVMVAEVERSWLDMVVAVDPASTDAVHDPNRLAAAMSTDQRTALRAAIVAIQEQPSFVPGSLRITLERGHGGCGVTLAADFAGNDPARRSAIAPYFSVLRVVFAGLAVEFAQPTLTVRFSYDDR